MEEEFPKFPKATKFQSVTQVKLK